MKEGGKRGPNILLITADQLRFDSIEPSGIHPVKTPNLLALSRESVTFANAYTHFPVCCPARQTLLHGRRPESFGALWNYSGALPTGSLQPDMFTWTRALRERGYTNVYLGKWGVHPTLDATSFGYDRYIGEGEYRKFQKERYPNVRYTKGYFGETNPIPVEDSATHWFADRAIEQLKTLSIGEGPWHMALHFSEPHLPCRPSGRFATMYDPAEIKPWAGFADTLEGKPYIQKQQLYNWGIEEYTWEDWAPVVARYFGIVSQLDEAIGRVLQAMEDEGAAEETIVIFTADHGDMCGSHRMMDKHYIMYDDVLRVPLMIRLGACADSPRRLVREEFVYNFMDLPPTILELAGLSGLAETSRFHGTSLLPLLTDGGGPASGWRDSIVSTYNGQQFGLYTQRSIRTTEWKYVWNTSDIDELYDLRRDPEELTNRIGDPELAAALAGMRLRLYERLAADEDPLVANDWMRRQLTEGRKL
jgi:arylsulfatase A-like enzyme